MAAELAEQIDKQIQVHTNKLSLFRCRVGPPGDCLEPDRTWEFPPEQASRVSVTLEAGFWRDAETLRRNARRCIAKFGVSTVLCVDLEYPATTGKRAVSISVYRPDGRDAEGKIKSREEKLVSVHPNASLPNERTLVYCANA